MSSPAKVSPELPQGEEVREAEAAQDHVVDYAAEAAAKDSFFQRQSRRRKASLLPAAVRISVGIVGVPFRCTGATVRMIFGTTTADAVGTDVFATDFPFTPVRDENGGCWCVLWDVTYQNCSAGAYNEFIVSFLTLDQRRRQGKSSTDGTDSVPLTAMVIPRSQPYRCAECLLTDPRAVLYVWRIWLDSPFSTAYGRELLGVDKHLAVFTPEDEGTTATTATVTNTNTTNSSSSSKNKNHEEAVGRQLEVVTDGDESHVVRVRYPTSPSFWSGLVGASLSIARSWSLAHTASFLAASYFSVAIAGTPGVHAVMDRESYPVFISTFHNSIFANRFVCIPPPEDSAEEPSQASPPQQTTNSTTTLTVECDATDTAHGRVLNGFTPLLVQFTQPQSQKFILNLPSEHVHMPRLFNLKQGSS